MMKSIHISDKDNVSVALTDLLKGERVEGVVLKEDIKRGHKFCVRPIKSGEKVIKYGNVIGTATSDISLGEHVHVHNMKTDLSGQLKYAYKPVIVENLKNADDKKIKAYRRKNGKIGIRNELWVVPTVGCVNAQAKEIANLFNLKYRANDFFDGAVAFTHPYGCSQVGADHERTKRILQQIVKHPNVGGVLVLGLGCENNRMDAFIETLGDFDEKRVEFLIAQQVNDEIDEGFKRLEKLYRRLENDRREDAFLSEIKIGLKCGGSDGLSGITANPLLGRLSDYMAAVNGTTVLTEVPEMFGAETLLMSRAKDEKVYSDIVKLINDFKAYYEKNGQPCYENPSPGNKQGGITTLEDKSLGCTQKSGYSTVCGVVFDGENIETNGLNLLNGPGNDMVACTNLAAAGCQIILFTTGRGTPFGGIVPTIKISTNTELFNFKRNWIDFNAGDLTEGATFGEKLDELIGLICDVSDGKKTKNEINNTREIAIFKTGVTL